MSELNRLQAKLKARYPMLSVSQDGHVVRLRNKKVTAPVWEGTRVPRLHEVLHFCYANGLPLTDCGLEPRYGQVIPHNCLG